MQGPARTLRRKLDAGPLTKGMCVRVCGAHLIAGRPVRRDEEPDDRVRLTRLDGSRWGLSARLHTGRWERTPFTGTIDELVEVMQTFMQHLVAS